MGEITTFSHVDGIFIGFSDSQTKQRRNFSQGDLKKG
jgi:hypothetical protein